MKKIKTTKHVYQTCCNSFQSTMLSFEIKKFKEYTLNDRSVTKQADLNSLENNCHSHDDQEQTIYDKKKLQNVYVIII